MITRLKDGQFTLPLDNGAQIRVAVRVNAQARSATIDFSGTSAQQSNNFNAPRAVCMAAVLYVSRTLVADDIPRKAGCLKPLGVIMRAGSIPSMPLPDGMLSPILPALPLPLPLPASPGAGAIACGWSFSGDRPPIPVGP